MPSTEPQRCGDLGSVRAASQTLKPSRASQTHDTIGLAVFLSLIQSIGNICFKSAAM